MSGGCCLCHVEGLPLVLKLVEQEGVDLHPQLHQGPLGAEQAGSLVQGPCQLRHRDPHRQGPHQELLAAQGEVGQVIANCHLLGQELLWDSKCHHQGLLESCPAQVVPLGDPRVAGLEDHWVEDRVAHGLRTFCDLV